ncbi:MAG: cobyrinate a,c-diamide synthase [Clostridium sp.]
MKKQIPRLLFAAPKSGSGKTLITCGFLEVLKRKGIHPVSFKCGPDYIDPMFHKYVLGIPGGNLDRFFLEEEPVRKELLEMTESSEGDLAVIEGVMGYYDGVGGISTKASSYDIARITRTPTILVLDCKGASVSLSAMIRGFLEYKKDSEIRGVILNRMSPVLYERIAPIMEADIGIPIFGYLPESSAFKLESRHLGLFLPSEIEKLREIISNLADQMERSVDLTGLIKLAEEAEPVEAGDDLKQQTRRAERTGIEKKVRIGVARDEAFCFYYQENLKLMEQMGAELVFFSPIHDEKLPEQLNGLLLGGGYPENYAAELAQNDSMLCSMRNACEANLPLLAECGGFLYLHRSLEGYDKKVYTMVGAIDATAFKTERLSRFGYITLTGTDGRQIKGHEFHYWESSDPGSCWEAQKPMGNQTFRCMHEEDGFICGFPHLYYPSNPEFLEKWLERCSVR